VSIRLTDVEAYVDVDFDIEDVLDQLSNEDYWAVRRYFEEDSMAVDLTNMEDSTVRLNAITWLRANGWTVEPEAS